VRRMVALSVPCVLHYKQAICIRPLLSLGGALTGSAPYKYAPDFERKEEKCSSSRIVGLLGFDPVSLVTKKVRLIWFHHVERP